MSAIFLAPARFADTALGGDTSVSAPLRNMLTDHLGMIWASTVAAPAVTLALGNLPLDSVVLWGTNMTSADSVRVRIGPNSNGTSPVFDQVFTGSTNVLAFLPAAITGAYLRLDFTRASGSITEVARLVVGTRLEADGISKDAEVTYDDESVRYSGPDWMVVDEYSVVQTWKFKVEGLTETEFFEGGWHNFIMTVGEKRPFVFIPYYPTSYAAQLTSFGAMNTPPRITWKTMVDRAIEMSLKTVSQPG